MAWVGLPGIGAAPGSAGRAEPLKSNHMKLGQTGLNKDGQGRQGRKRNAADKPHQALFVFSPILFILSILVPLSVGSI